MNKIRFRITDKSTIDNAILVDGKPVEFKKNKFGNFEYEHTTPNDTVNIKIYSLNELKHKLWFLMSIIFFIISGFGLLDWNFKKKYKVLEYDADIKIKEDSFADIKIAKYASGTKAVTLTTICENTENANAFKDDPILKKRARILLWTRLALWVVALVVLAIIFIK